MQTFNPIIYPCYTH